MRSLRFDAELGCWLAMAEGNERMVCVLRPDPSPAHLAFITAENGETADDWREAALEALRLERGRQPRG